MMQEVFDHSTRAAGTRVGKSFSRIDNSGNGLFTYKRIREGNTVGEYFGEVIIKGEDYGTVNNLIASYSMGNHDESIIYCAFSVHRNKMLCMMGYINDPLDDDRCNVRAVWRGNRCFIVATRDIRRGEELLMAYGAAYWMRDCWSSELIRQAWNNYGVRRTDAQWREVYNRSLAMEEDPEETSDTDSVEGDGEDEVMFRGEPVQRILMDLTQGDEPVISIIHVAVTPDAVPEVPAFVPLTVNSPEYLEYLQNEHIIIRNSCA